MESSTCGRPDDEGSVDVASGSDSRAVDSSSFSSPSGRLRLLLRGVDSTSMSSSSASSFEESEAAAEPSAGRRLAICSMKKQCPSLTRSIPTCKKKK